MFSFMYLTASLSDDGGGVDLVLHELVRPPQQLGRYYDDRGCAIADFLVLLLGEVDEDLARGVLDVEQREDGRAVVGHRHVADVVDHHLVETRRPERRLDDIGDCLRREHVLVANVLSADFLAAEDWLY
jgi:hypothetical protein